MSTPKFIDDPAFRDLREYDIKNFQAHAAGRTRIDFSGADLRGVDLSQVVDINQLVLRDAYLRDADLRGLDMRNLDLEGCSIHNAKIGGAYFPKNISAQEIANSVQHGTRLRTDC
ncbi:MAG: pentapeptide repeat-containing protein [Pirellulales bacterium]